MQIHLDTTQVTHTRKVYALFDAFGDFGGIKEVLILLAGIFMGPLNQNLMNIELLKSRYKIKLTNNKIKNKGGTQKNYSVKDKNSYYILAVSSMGALCRKRSSEPRIL